jgi:hypothetical protein
MLGVGIAWLGSFAIIYFMINGGDVRESSPISTWLFTFWHVLLKAFFPGFSSEGMVWLNHSFMNFFETAGFNRPLSIIGFSLAGMIILLRQQRALFALLLLPLAITLFASYLKQYVFYGRLILFLLPFFFMLIGISIAQLGSQFSFLQGIPFFNVVVGVLLTALLLSPSIKYPFSQQVVAEESRSALEYLQKHRAEGDKIYIYYWADPAFHYYAPFYGFDYDSCQHITPPDTKKGSFKEVDFYWSQKENLIITKKESENVQCILGFSESLYESAHELAKLKGHGRVWFFFTHLGDTDRQKGLTYLSTFGQILDEKIYPGASLYLYDMGNDAQ